MGASSRQYWRHDRPADPDPDAARHDDPAVRQRVRGPGDGLPADRRPSSLVTLVIGARSAATSCTTSGSATPWRWAWSSIMAISIFAYSLPPAPRRALAAMTERRGSAGRRSRARPARSSSRSPRPRPRDQAPAPAPRLGGRAWVVFIIGVPLLRPAARRHLRVLDADEAGSRPTPTPCRPALLRASATRSSSASSRSSSASR